jgi:deferrochelatase/peroxidase EfeB
LDARRDPSGSLPRAEDSPDSADVGRNGTYLVIRQLRQDVRGFWQAMDRCAGGVPAARERLAAQMVGRTLIGEPVVLEASADVSDAARASAVGTTARSGAGAGASAGAGPGTSATLRASSAGADASVAVGSGGSAGAGPGTGAAPRASAVGADASAAAGTRTGPDNDFTYEADLEGHRCPIGAHIRRANPRNADLPPGRIGVVSWLIRTLGFSSSARALDLAASTRFHRLLRRGREYGVRLTPTEALSAPAAQSGLQFICLNANIQRQFEFVQGAWLMSTKFNGLHEESDPLLGNRLPGTAGTRCDYFSMPQADGPTQRLEGLPQFVTVAGGAYFFLPGIRALRFLVARGAAQQRS